MAEKGEHQNVARVAIVLDALAMSKNHGMRLTDIVEATGLGTSVVHRLLAGLAAHGFVEFDKASNRYHVGLQMVRWAASSTERYGLAPFVGESMERLAQETEDTVYFSLVSGLDAVCVDRREGDYPIKTLTLNVGDRRPLGVGSGSMALLAFQAEEIIADVLENDDERRREYGMDSDYIRTAMLKGLSKRKIIWRHALRNALIAPFTAIMLHVNWLIGGVVVVEVLFNYPGLGRLLLDAALRNDIILLEGGTLVLTFVAVSTQVIGDIGLYFMNPRIRFE